MTPASTSPWTTARYGGLGGCGSPGRSPAPAGCVGCRPAPPRPARRPRGLARARPSGGAGSPRLTPSARLLSSFVMGVDPGPTRGPTRRRGASAVHGHEHAEAGVVTLGGQEADRPGGVRSAALEPDLAEILDHGAGPGGDDPQ